MDMKRILQAVDGVATKPVVGADSMARFLRVVDEAAINQLPAVKVPPVPALPAQDGDQGDGTMVTDRGDGTKTFSTATGTFTYDAQGKAIKFKTPNIGGLGQTIDLVTGNTENNYDQGPASIQQKNDAQGNLISNRIRADLGPTSIQTKQYASGVTKLTAQGDGADSIVGVDASAKRLGVDPDKFAAFQQQLPANESLNKFLSIIDKNDVSILNEGKNPHKVALPVQMAMQHYQQQESIPGGHRPRVIDRYFQQAEQEFTERKEEKRALMHQYASIIAERVLMKESEQGVAEGLDSEKKQRLKDLIDQYRDATDPEAYYGLNDEYPDAEEVIAQIRQEFGNRTADSVEQGPSMHYPRPGHSRGYDPMQYKSSPRITKSGVLNKQDVGSIKRDIKQRLKQGVAEGSEKRCMQCGMTNCSCKPGTCKCKPIKGWTPGKGFKKIKEAGESGWTRNGMAGVGLQSNAPEGGHLSLGETPIEMDPAEPNNPTVHGHQGANSMSLKGRIQQARAQLTELAELAQSDNLIVWEGICKKAKGGVFMGLEQNLEQIRHGIHELAAKRKRGGASSRGIDRNIG